jgi:CheY-like chemotaxis protein
MSSSDYVLVVEDDEDLREMLVELLSEEGHSSCTASNGEEALAFLRTAEPPCLMLLDQKMPVMDGEELMKALRTIPSLARVPICVFAADKRFVPDGAAAVIVKPIDVVALLRVVDHHCREQVTSANPASHRAPTQRASTTK